MILSPDALYPTPRENCLQTPTKFRCIYKKQTNKTPNLTNSDMVFMNSAMTFQMSLECMQAN